VTDEPSTQPPQSDEHLVAIREQVYKDPRPLEELQKYYDWPLTHDVKWVYDVVRVLLSLYVWIFFRTTCVDSRNIPTSGPLIFAPNHFSNVDHFFLGQATRRKVQFMAKSQLYKGWFAWVMKVGGVFPIRRGYRDEQSFEVALSILERGGTICTYCEGGRSRTGRLADSAKPGIGRIALQSGATVVPAAISGSQKVRNWKRLQLPKVDVLYGEPLRFEVVAEPTREQQQAAADQIFDEIKALYAQLQGRHAGAVRAEHRARRAAAAG
jgi:1-acyl-sn-glycerol-3-phosphate acyltransferase